MREAARVLREILCALTTGHRRERLHYRYASRYPEPARVSLVWECLRCHRTTA